ncbi:MAG: ABC transporter substrate-binding protein, partial [Bacteroidota bacterium]
LGNQIVGVDITSTYPPELKDIPRVGHNRNIQPEGILALQPDIVIGQAGALKPEIINQLGQLTKLVLLDHEMTRAGTSRMMKALQDSLGLSNQAKTIDGRIDSALALIAPLPQAPKVLFVYARGVGNLHVAGKKTSLDEIIRMAGGKNAVQDFEDFKPLTTEALVAANPDVILMFDSGLKSLEGMDGLLEIPGMAMTQAGINKQVITMDGQKLSGFGPRVGQAALELNRAFQEMESLLASGL